MNQLIATCTNVTVTLPTYLNRDFFFHQLCMFGVELVMKPLNLRLQLCLLRQNLRMLLLPNGSDKEGAQDEAPVQPHG